VTVLDAFAVIAFLRDEPARDDVEKLLRSDDTCRMSTINVAELVNVLHRSSKVDLDVIDRQIQILELSGVIFEAPSTEIGLLAGRLRAIHYDRNDCAISLADCFALALAITTQEPLATADTALATVTIAAGGQLMGLPNSAGKMPQPRL